MPRPAGLRRPGPKSNAEVVADRAADSRVAACAIESEAALDLPQRRPDRAAHQAVICAAGGVGRDEPTGLIELPVTAGVGGHGQGVGNEVALRNADVNVLSARRLVAMHGDEVDAIGYERTLGGAAHVEEHIGGRVS